MNRRGVKALSEREETTSKYSPLALEPAPVHDEGCAAGAAH